jgi:hypothetical protein
MRTHFRASKKQFAVLLCQRLKARQNGTAFTFQICEDLSALHLSSLTFDEESTDKQLFVAPSPMNLLDDLS